MNYSLELAFSALYNRIRWYMAEVDKDVNGLVDVAKIIDAIDRAYEDECDNLPEVTIQR